ncbi:MAG TPA: HAD-IIB family hydrolase [Pseudorhodoplanes sp.]|jgi:HAD superfamily hydrolase (TIGR01484 family)|nr:HAD-IIB family hydrolase [Pseudorhodoplanes sp.]
MRPIGELGVAAARRIGALLTDIDDTITTDGRLSGASYDALERLHDNGLFVIPITGRPAGWCDLIARFWPVDGVVGENGALYFRYDHAERTMRRWYAAPQAEREKNRRKLDAIRNEVLEKVPGAAVAADQAFRVADLAIDFREDVAPLDDRAIKTIVSIFNAHGAQAKISSIHVNGWFGQYDKLTTSLKMLNDEFVISSAAARDRVLFVGDSPNDEPMFRYFPLSVGVANVRDAAHLMTAKPAFVTAKKSGAGFVELADRLLALRG